MKERPTRTDKGHTKIRRSPLYQRGWLKQILEENKKELEKLPDWLRAPKPRER